MDLNGARRKNVTRETTNTLKAWLNEHRKNPYPTKGEKIMLAIITKMTLTQVSTWFANARRRLKKENKMTWSPRNRCDDDDTDGDGKDGSGSVHDRERDGDATNSSQRRDEGDSDIVDIEEDSNQDGKRLGASSPLSDVGSLSDSESSQPGNSSTPNHHHHHHSNHHHPHHTLQPNKPRIWSIVDTATSNNSSSLPLMPPSLATSKATGSTPGTPSGGSIGGVSPTVAAIAANRAARLDYLSSPYAKPGGPWYNPGNFSVASSAAAAAAFSPLYTCPPTAIMSHLAAAGSGAPIGPGGVPISPHLAAAAAESSLNRLRSAAAAAGAALSGSSTDNIAAINKTIISIGERTLSGTNGANSKS